MNKKLKRIWFRLFARRILRKIERDKKYRYGSIEIELEPGIFHPRYFKSSQLLLKWVEDTDLYGKTIVEVGSGSGITSLRATQKGAKVLAIDINPKAVEKLISNAEKNNLQLEVLESDLFDKVDNGPFDCILINPPFYPKKPRNFAEHAWFCGDDFEYFEKLFKQLKVRGIRTGIVMTLSDDCDLQRIMDLGSKFGYSFEKIQVAKSFFEKNFLFEINSNS